MQPVEYARLARVDRTHWYYRGKRTIVRHWIERTLQLGVEDLLIDAGMGAGTFVREMASTCRVIGLDDHEESLEVAREGVEKSGGSVLKSSLTSVPLPDGCASVVTALDVIEHIEDHHAAMAELVRLTRPGGIIVLTVPAIPALWSDWDVAFHHFRRYTKAELESLVLSFGLGIERLAFFNTLAVLPAFLIRKWMPRRERGGDRGWAEQWIPSGPLNRVLEAAMVEPAKWSRFRPPIGLSLLAVLRVPERSIQERAGRKNTVLV